MTPFVFVSSIPPDIFLNKYAQYHVPVDVSYKWKQWVNKTNKKNTASWVRKQKKNSHMQAKCLFCCRGSILKSTHCEWSSAPFWQQNTIDLMLTRNWGKKNKPQAKSTNQSLNCEESTPHYRVTTPYQNSQSLHKKPPTPPPPHLPHCK